MTGEELAALPIGSIVKMDEDEGEIIKAGRMVHIMWPDVNRTVFVDTESKAWQTFISWLEAE